MINMPEKVKRVLKTIKDNGFRAHIVGGCVRDTIMHKTPHDFDITTSAKPEEIKAIFEKTVDTGIKHGTVTVILEGEIIEVTTYRIDGDYLDNRRPEEVFFTKDIDEDLRRRDFTMNAIAYNEDEGFIDLFEGQKDIERKIVRCVGNPDERFNEDGLRMLRAVRFSAQLGFKIEDETYESLKRNCDLIKNISAERIREELTKILISNHPERMMMLHETGIMKHILPEFESCIGFPQDNPYHIYDVGEHIIEATKTIESESVLRWTMFLHDLGKPLTKTFDEKGIGHFYGHGRVSEELANNILERLKFDNKSIRKITKLIRFHDYRINATEKSVRKAVAKIGEDIFVELLIVQRADDSAKNIEIKREDIRKSRDIEKIYYEIKEKSQCLCKNEMKINGNDLIKIGITEGKAIGKILAILFDVVIEYPEMNDKEKLLEIVRKNYKKY